MGLTLSILVSKYFGPIELNTLLLGLDAAGKTTILYRLQPNGPSNIPPVGWNIENVEYKHFKFTCWDFGGNDRLRPLWRHYYQESDSIIFVVDSTDYERIELAREEMHRLLSEELLQGAPLLIFANKIDLDGMNVNKITEILNLRSITGREWYIQGCSATSGDGLYEGLEWITKAVVKRKKKGRLFS